MREETWLKVSRDLGDGKRSSGGAGEAKWRNMAPALDDMTAPTQTDKAACGANPLILG
jgi:hypothetical protein